MKIHLSLCLSLGLCALAAAYARADDDDKPITPPHDPDINSPTYDGSTFNLGQSKKPTAAEVQTEKEAQQEKATWLVRGYEQQMEMVSAAKGETDLLDPYTQVSTDKNLAKLAGLTSAISPNPTDITNLHAITDSAKDSPTLRLDPSQTSSRQKLQPIVGGAFKPLITPLSATDAAGLSNFYATLPAGTPVAAPPAANTPPVTEMPGFTAARGDFPQGNLTDDLTPGPLPDDSHNQQAADSGDKNSAVLPQVPSGDTTQQLQRAVQVATTGKTTPQPAPVKVVIPPDPELIPKPLAAPIFTAGRPQIQDPNDFIR